MSNYKSPIRTLNTDFTAGELDPMLAMRHDTGLLPSGARKLTNMFVHQSGAASRRPGFRNIRALEGRRRLVEFEYDIDEKYILAFGAGVVDIYDAIGTPLPSIGGQPWTATSVWSMNYVQKGDVMVIVHPEFRMRRLARTGSTSFAITTLQFSTDTNDNVLNQPYMKYQLPAVTMGVSAYTIGSGRTVTCSSAIFTIDWIGEHIRIFNCEIILTAYLTPTTMTGTVVQEVRKRLGIAPLRFTDGSPIIEVTHALHGLADGNTVNFVGAADWDNNIVKADINGDRVINVIDEDHYSFTAGGTDNSSISSGDGGGPSIFVRTTAKTRDWAEPVWSNRKGWPGAVCLHENRLWLGGSHGAPTYISGSAIGSYYDHNIRDGLDDESVQGNISNLQRIVHLVSGKTLQIFCESSESIVETQSGQPITPSNMKVTVQTGYGASDVRPVLFDGGTVFSQYKGKSIRELMYDYNSDAHVAPPISVRAAHLINAPKDIAVVAGTPTRPEQYCFVVNGNGSMAVFHSIRSEKLAAWTQLTIGGTSDSVDSVCAIGPTPSAGPRVYISVTRAGDYSLEMLDLDATDIWLDYSRKLVGSPSASWDLGEPYGGLTVDVMSHDHYLGRYTVGVDNVLTLPVTVGEVVVGYDYGISVIPYPPDKEMNDGSLTGEIRRVVSATVHWHSSTAVAINGQEQIHFSPMAFDPPPDWDEPVLSPFTDITIAAPRFSGKKRVRLLGYGRDPSITIDQPTPGPLTVLGMTMEVSL